MIVVTFTDKIKSATSCGLTQWDFGQKLKICGLNLLSNTEVHFALLGNADSIIQIGESLNGNIVVDIPDELLKDGRYIYAYVYLANEDEGQTIRTIILPVIRRPEPEQIDVPKNKNILEHLLGCKADNLELANGMLQLSANGKAVGDRVRLPSSGGGREIELKNDGTTICWRYTDSNEWLELVHLEDLKGPAGETPKFEIRNGHLFAIYEKEE